MFVCLIQGHVEGMFQPMFPSYLQLFLCFIYHTFAKRAFIVVVAKSVLVFLFISKEPLQTKQGLQYTQQ